MPQLTERAWGILALVFFIIAFGITGTMDAQTCEQYGVCP